MVGEGQRGKEGTGTVGPSGVPFDSGAGAAPARDGRASRFTVSCEAALGASRGTPPGDDIGTERAALRSAAAPRGTPHLFTAAAAVIAAGLGAPERRRKFLRRFVRFGRRTETGRMNR